VARIGGGGGGGATGVLGEKLEENRGNFGKTIFKASN